MQEGSQRTRGDKMALIRLMVMLCVLCAIDGSSEHDGFRGMLRKLRHRINYRDRRDKSDIGNGHYDECRRNCGLQITNIYEARTLFQDYLEEQDTRLVYFKVYLDDYKIDIMESYPYMVNSFGASEWVWVSQTFGRKLLGLPLDADVLSLYLLNTLKKSIDLRISTKPSNCLIVLTPECRLHAVRKLLIENVTHVERHRHRRDFVCHQAINETGNQSHLLHRCCDTTAFRSGDHACQLYTSYGREIAGVLFVINIIAFIATLFSPILILKFKIALKYDSVTKFFRASLKHGITGQRNYVIRVNSRQLINLSDPKPFSIPCFLFRLLLHCYGEGRCCIHWWGEWRHQPAGCKKYSHCRKCWFVFWRIFAIVFVFPLIFYLAVALYAPKIEFYMSITQYMEYLDNQSPIRLNINMLGASLIPKYRPVIAIWFLFSFVSFIYTILLLSWPSNPLERCLLRYEGKRPFEQPNALYNRMTKSYKSVLRRLAYGDFQAKPHFFRIPCIPWGMRRTLHCLVSTLMQIPILHIGFNLFMFDSKVFNLRDTSGQTEKDESEDAMEFERPSCRNVCKWFIVCFVWLGFLLILAGYSTTIFLMTQILLNIAFFTFLAAVLHASTILPWVCFVIIVVFYINDTLAMINREHRDILMLIDENSPRISAVEDSEEVFREGSVQILKTHNLGAVKFIDGDNTEYVSKELYYNVCTDLKCGWSRSLRRIFTRLSIIFLFVLFVFLSLSALGAFIGSAMVVILVAVAMSLLPKLLDFYISLRARKPDRKTVWAKIMPEVLDRHIRVDRSQCLDSLEEDLTTYDVRPVGLLEMDVPRMTQQRSLNLWKFPWVVSADQQTQTHENFIVALANKLAAASFLSKIVTRAYSPDLEEESVLRHWCLLVENCILEGSATASSINGVPVETIRLFPRDVQALVSPFVTGNTIDNVVDNINRELYGPYTKGVLVSIGNTSLALGKLDNTIFAFNSSCHGDQVTDLFGAVLIQTDFNTQNLQSTIKYIVDPYSPDSVPVYSIVPMEGFVFRSPEILEMESPTTETETSTDL